MGASADKHKRSTKSPFSLQNQTLAILIYGCSCYLITSLGYSHSLSRTLKNFIFGDSKALHVEDYVAKRLGKQAAESARVSVSPRPSTNIRVANAKIY